MSNIPLAKKPSLFGALKNLVVEELPDKTAPGSIMPMIQSAPIQTPTPFMSPIQGTMESNDSVVLKKVTDIFISRVPAVYSSFLQYYGRLTSAIPDESTRFKAALAASQCNPIKLQEELLQSDKVIAGIGDEFNNSLNSSLAKLENKDEFKQLDALVVQKELEISKLTQEVSDLKNRKNTLHSENENQKLNLQKSAQAFFSAINSIQQSVQNHKRILSQG